ncbi:hypothetical protein PINS_up023904 [Pythium insidiosum]|nr:hypothetical protein PINS_up023904 [Pythium insidiosum]
MNAVATEYLKGHKGAFSGIRDCLDKTEFSCQFWQEHQYPCIQACAAIMRGRHDAFNYISDYYLASHLQEPLAPYAMPVDFSYYEPDDMFPR